SAAHRTGRTGRDDRRDPRHDRAGGAARRDAGADRAAAGRARRDPDPPQPERGRDRRASDGGDAGCRPGPRLGARLLQLDIGMFESREGRRQEIAGEPGSGRTAAAPTEEDESIAATGGATADAAPSGSVLGALVDVLA